MFNRTQNQVLLAGAFLLVSCTDISGFCRHTGSGYLQRWLQARAVGVGRAGQAAAGQWVVGNSETRQAVVGTEKGGNGARRVEVETEKGVGGTGRAMAETEKGVGGARRGPEQEETPRPVSWRQLKDVVFNRIWDEKMDMPMLYPQFSRGIKSLNGAHIRIAGYVIPWM